MQSWSQHDPPPGPWTALWYGVAVACRTRFRSSTWHRTRMAHSRSGTRPRGARPTSGLPTRSPVRRRSLRGRFGSSDPTAAGIANSFIRGPDCHQPTAPPTRACSASSSGHRTGDSSRSHARLRSGSSMWTGLVCACSFEPGNDARELAFNVGEAARARPRRRAPECLRSSCSRVRDTRSVSESHEAPAPDAEVTQFGHNRLAPADH